MQANSEKKAHILNLSSEGREAQQSSSWSRTLASESVIPLQEGKQVSSSPLELSTSNKVSHHIYVG